MATLLFLEFFVLFDKAILMLNPQYSPDQLLFHFNISYKD